MEKGVKLMQSGKLDEALQLFINLSKSDPEWADKEVIKFLKFASIKNKKR